MSILTTSFQLAVEQIVSVLGLNVLGNKRFRQNILTTITNMMGIIFIKLNFSNDIASTGQPYYILILRLRPTIVVKMLGTP